jgi:hypothetical protein
MSFAIPLMCAVALQRIGRSSLENEDSYAVTVQARIFRGRWVATGGRRKTDVGLKADDDPAGRWAFRE